MNMALTLREKRTQRRGFSLIELGVVMAILGILLAIGLPRLLGQRDAQVEDSTATSAAKLADVAYVDAKRENAIPNDPSWWNEAFDDFDPEDRADMNMVLLGSSGTTAVTTADSVRFVVFSQRFGDDLWHAVCIAVPTSTTVKPKVLEAGDFTTYDADGNGSADYTWASGGSANPVAVGPGSALNNPALTERCGA